MMCEKNENSKVKLLLFRNVCDIIVRSYILEYYVKFFTATAASIKMSAAYKPGGKHG